VIKEENQRKGSKIMRGHWNLNSGEAAYWTEVVDEKLRYLVEHKDEIDDIDLSQEDIGPYQLYSILESLGFERDDWEDNGWEQDTWARFSHAQRDMDICVFSCGMTFELTMCLNRVGEWRA
jgi:hypothetical protein